MMILFKKITGVLLCCLLTTGAIAQTIDLSNLTWRLALDKQAAWQHDILSFPSKDIQYAGQRIPTNGWNSLTTFPAVNTTLPATVEQYFWGSNGNSFGSAGNYVGVSWFTTDLQIPENFSGKQLFLQFESVRLRAEVFVNEQFVGSDLVNGTPFSFDITKAAIPGGNNRIAVRITDPNGNFNWKDSQTFFWGNYRIIPTHGFGGITGKVLLSAKNKVIIDDVFVKNKPNPHEVDIEITVKNTDNKLTGGFFELSVVEANNPQKVVYSKNFPLSGLPSGESVVSYTALVKNARLWHVDTPELYKLNVKYVQSDKVLDSFERRFGFRWFEVRDNKGDKQFFLNGKRIVLRTAISWGFWPDNGITPTDSLAKKQILIAKKLGLNMLNFHRGMAQTNVLDYADELGLLYFAEPGGNQYPIALFNATDSLGKMQADFYFKVRTERLLRMIKRDRNHPSLVIYNMHNERGANPQQQDKDQMLAAHKLDETRILTYNSCNGNNPENKPDEHFKLHLLPYEHSFRDIGWWDEHHAGGPGVYHDYLYKNALNYHRASKNTSEIVYWGEDGAIGTPPRLELIRNELLQSGKTKGWEADDYLKWYAVYDNFLQSQGFSKAFPTVDSLTRAMGNVAFYYQGRVIENIRINNVVDGYAVNGWESMKLENHSGIVDNYRNPKGDVDLIARYNQPLFVAVKINKKVLAVNDTTVVDFHCVNEKNITGKCLLKVALLDENGKLLETKQWSVQLAGGTTYGQLLQKNWKISIQHAGYTTVKAELLKNGKTVASGSDKIFAVVTPFNDLKTTCMVADTTQVLQRFLSSKQMKVKSYTSGFPEGNCLIVGAFEPTQGGAGMSDIMEWVYNGNTLIVINNTERWADFLVEKEILDYRGAKKLGTSWFGGNYFVKEHPLFESLPQNCVFNWEYQCFAAYNRKRTGLRLFNGETVVGCVSDHKKEIYSALSVIPAGRGKIILSTLDINSCIQEVKRTGKLVDIDGENASMDSFNTANDNAANLVGQRLLYNMIKFAE